MLSSDDISIVDFPGAHSAYARFECDGVTRRGNFHVQTLFIVHIYVVTVMML